MVEEILMRFKRKIVMGLSMVMGLKKILMG